jgi:hypothetical protein
MSRIACLHTADSNIQVFDAALQELGTKGVELRHSVRADLLAAAEQASGLTPEIAERTAGVLRGLCDGADAVLLTCSTLGPAAEAAAATASVPMFRVDATLAREAVRSGGKVAVLCAVQTTMEPTRLLFEREAQNTGAEVVMHFVPGAWDVFKAGDRSRYLSMIAVAADEAFRGGANQVALAQASMAGAAKLAADGRAPLTSPAVGLATAIEAAAA